MPWTSEELAEMAKADAEIEAHFVLSNEEFTVSREWDRKATLEAMLPEQRKRYESQRRYRAANKEKVAESQRRYRAANKEKAAEYQRRYRAANKEKVAEYQRRYYAANKEKVAESQRRYYAANKEKVAESKQALKAARAAAGLTQTQAAEILGVGQSTICYWENIVPPYNWKEIVEIISAKGNAPASAGTETSASQI